MRMQQQHNTTAAYFYIEKMIYTYVCPSCKREIDLIRKVEERDDPVECKCNKV